MFSFNLQMSPLPPEELFPFEKNDDITNRKLLYITVSTIQERDKKNAKYYVGDYYRGFLFFQYKRMRCIEHAKDKGLLQPNLKVQRKATLKNASSSSLY